MAGPLVAGVGDLDRGDLQSGEQVAVPWRT